MNCSRITRLAQEGVRLSPRTSTGSRRIHGASGQVHSAAGQVHSPTGQVSSDVGHMLRAEEDSTAGQIHSRAGQVHDAVDQARDAVEEAIHRQLASVDVFRSRSARDLLRTLAVYQVCAVDSIVDNSLQLLRRGERLLGSWLLQRLVSPFYRQFVAGADRQQLSEVVTSLREQQVRLMLTSLLEADVDEQTSSDSQMNANLDEAISQLLLVRQLTADEEEPAIQTKFTAHMDVNLLIHASRVFSTTANPTRLVERLAGALVTSGQVTVPGLTRLQQRLWDAAVLRIKALGDACARHNMTLFVDGEFSYTNPAISWITLALMAALNTDRPVVRGTQQCYLKATPANLEREYGIARRLGACFGAKLVRGAYLARERQVARQERRACVVCDSYEETTANYTRAVEFAVHRVAEDQGRTQIMVATHNYDSIVHALRLSADLQLPVSRDGLSFGQVYGMADYLTIPLARAGHRVYKAVPFGAFSTVMPYLSRRAAESRLVQQGVRLERRLLISELASRISSRISSRGQPAAG